MTMDIFGEKPYRNYSDIIFSLKIGRNFRIAAHYQEGFVRLAIFTKTSERWHSPVLVYDKETVAKLLSESTNLILVNIDDEPTNKKPNLKVVRTN
jgi:hypothetical protein